MGLMLWDTQAPYNCSMSFLSGCSWKKKVIYLELYFFFEWGVLKEKIEVQKGAQQRLVFIKHIFLIFWDRKELGFLM